jgi:hypothetical protein
VGLLQHLVHDLNLSKINKMAAFFPSTPCAYSWVLENLILLSNQPVRW